MNKKPIKELQSVFDKSQYSNENMFNSLINNDIELRKNIEIFENILGDEKYFFKDAFDKNDKFENSFKIKELDDSFWFRNLVEIKKFNPKNVESNYFRQISFSSGLYDNILETLNSENNKKNTIYDDHQLNFDETTEIIINKVEI
ncbi:Uncharacterised protein [Mycoplasmopsis maculosa]|uniref:Uncharacterized protein n=1 Tax=Mycoplasmopsis maculosa TaxID=114885 RepID=A0A449B4C5_9BACT|nr:hypothetical protein [Mycoplasmopsis maculosa]VEU75426.1 Uncharacterised protein [Mycoplasmopsis maculosa]